MPFTIEEITTDGAQMVTGISQEQGGGEATYRIYGPGGREDPPTRDELNEAVNRLNGGVNNIVPVATTFGIDPNGRVDRVLPPIHPFRPELSVGAVKSIVGVGRNEADDSVDIFGQSLVTDQYPKWNSYDLKVEYVKRPYFLLANELVAVKGDLNYFLPDGSSRNFVYAEEWTRFTSETRAPLNDTVNATQGMMVFHAASGLDPEGAQYGFQNYMFLGNQAIEITWYLVPYRYLLDFVLDGVLFQSYLDRFVGCVNQYDFKGFPAGSLMYLGATPQNFIPCNPSQTKAENAVALGLDQDLLCNVKLRFVYTSRVGDDVPTWASMANKNDIPAGHNLLPNFRNRRFNYVSGPADLPVGSQRASFQSFPFQLFFTDPLLEQPGGTI